MWIDHRPNDELSADVRKWRMLADERLKKLTAIYKNTPTPILLFAQNDGRLPVDLQHYAGACSVKDVVFRRLLDRGGLAVEGENFIVYIGCRKDQAGWFSKEYTENGGRNLPAEVRFTLAHELAHTFFFDLVDGKQLHKVPTDQHSAWQKLESECDRAAGHLMIPVDFSNRNNNPGTAADVLDPNLILSRIKALGVPSRTFVDRLHWRIGGVTDRDGAIFYLQSRPEEPNLAVIHAWAMSGSADVLMRERAQHNGDFRQICNDEALLIYGGTRDDMRFSFQGRNARVRCAMDEGSGFLVTIEL
jgi:hypothetical protein